jgi:hypothetical protein
MPAIDTATANVSAAPTFRDLPQPAAVVELITIVVWEHTELAPAQAILAALTDFIGPDSVTGQWLTAVNPDGGAALAAIQGGEHPASFAYAWIVALDPERIHTVRAAIAAITAGTPFLAGPLFLADAELARIAKRGFAHAWAEIWDETKADEVYYRSPADYNRRSGIGQSEDDYQQQMELYEEAQEGES